jgi:OOP family OmpA-OmpF porin
MKKLSKLTMFIAFAVLATGASAQEIYNWRNNYGDVWKNPAGLCWRASAWTPATAAAGCDQALVGNEQAAEATESEAPPDKGIPLVLIAPAGAAPAPTPVAPATATTPVAPITIVAAAAPNRVTYAADTFFDFDKAVLKPSGKTSLDQLYEKTKEINLEVIVAIGHTDSVGDKEYNLKLSIKRAEAVKAYLLSKGLAKNRIYTEGKGEDQPVADNATKAGRAKNRRVDVEVKGVRNN